MAALDVGPIALIGLGAVGGSVAKALIRDGVSLRGWTRSRVDAAGARRAGVNVAASVADAVADVALVLIAVPVSAHAAVAADVTDAAPSGVIILHAASLQRASALGGSSAAIGTHPLAGTHRSGFAAADANMFAGCTVSIETRASDGVRRVAERLWRAVGAQRFEFRSAEDHDRLMTWISHLPQLASTALATTLAAAGVASEALGPGGRDATRLAASPWEMWSGILAAARPDVARAAALLEQSVGEMRSALETGDMRTVERIWTDAASWAGSR